MYRLIERLTVSSGQEVDTITLSYAERTRSRLRVITGTGRDAGLFLPRGTILNNGNLLRGEDGLLVKVCAATETVSSASTSDPLLLSKACYHLGNRHVAVQIMDGCVRYLHDHVLDEMLASLGLVVEILQAPFEPESGAYSRGGPTHAHE